MYEKMYHKLFNAVTDALEQIEICNYGLAERILRDGQQKTESMYIGEESEDEIEISHGELLSPSMNILLHAEPIKHTS